MLQAEFTNELARNRSVNFSSSGSRSLTDGRSAYIEQVEREIAEFHGAEFGLIVGSGYEANMAIFTALPQSGDVVLYDELTHASVHDGLRKSRASSVSFRHNDVESFREQLLSILDQPLIKDGKRSVIVAVESLYSMEGDVCPLKELVKVANLLFEDVHFYVDEAHSTGILGQNGSGLVSLLGLQDEIAVRLHTCGKALAANGGEYQRTTRTV